MEGDNGEGFFVISFLIVFSWSWIMGNFICHFLNQSIFIEQNNCNGLVEPSSRMVLICFAIQLKGQPTFSQEKFSHKWYLIEGDINLFLNMVFACTKSWRRVNQPNSVMYYCHSVYTQCQPTIYQFCNSHLLHRYVSQSIITKLCKHQNIF